MHIDFAIEVADIANDGFIFHFHHVAAHDNAFATGGGDKNITDRSGFFHSHDLVAFHSSLQSANRIDLSNNDASAEATHTLGATLTYIAETTNDYDFTSNHNVGASLDTIGQRFAAAIKVVELRLGDGVVDVDSRS